MASSATETYRAARDLLVELRESPDEAARRFRWPVFDGPFNWAIDWFDAVARDSDRLALWIVEEDGTERQCSYRELARRSGVVARWLAGLGVGKGDHVMLMLGNQIELWESMLAIAKLGAVIMPTATASGGADLADRLVRGGVRHVIADSAEAAKFDGLDLGGDLERGRYTRVAVGERVAGWHAYADAAAASSGTASSGSASSDADGPAFESTTAPDDPLLLYFTSGTTRRPKLVEHTQVSYPVGHLTTMYWLGMRPGDVHLNVSSPGWAKHAWSSFFAPLIAEATIFVYNYSRFDAAALLAQLRRAQVTTFCAPPTVWRMLINADLSGGPGSLREVVSAGEPLNPEVIERVERAWGLTIRDGYGQTETTAQVANPPGAPLKPGSMGRPLPGCPIVLVDPVTGELSDTEGEICVDLSARPVALMTGYRGDERLNAAAMDGGYYHTGDVAQRDADGYISYIGRSDDVFKSSDYKVSPFELESVLIQHPAVAEAAVVPAPDEVRLAIPKAYVALAPGWEPTAETALAILRHAREQLPRYLRVRRVEFFELPKTISGKIRRTELRAREEEAVSTGRIGSEHRDSDFPEF